MGRNRIEWYSNERDNIRRIHLRVTFKSHDVVDKIEISWRKILRASLSSYKNISLHLSVGNFGVWRNGTFEKRIASNDWSLCNV